MLDLLELPDYPARETEPHRFIFPSPERTRFTRPDLLRKAAASAKVRIDASFEVQGMDYAFSQIRLGGLLEDLVPGPAFIGQITNEREPT